MRTVSIGAQGFEKLRTRNCFYVDKTDFIRQWWESEDDVTLITRPRRFGKTLNMDTLNCFFSNRYEGRSDLFEGLSIWDYETYRQIQGTYPVIFLSFADVKSTNYKDARNGIIHDLKELFLQFKRVWAGDTPQEKEKYSFMEIGKETDDADVCRSLRLLSAYLHERYGKKAIVLLDEYDGAIETEFNEEIIFQQLYNEKKAIWSLMLASGYLKIDDITVNPENFRKAYRLKLTNMEVKMMFEDMIATWFDGMGVPYSEFIHAMQTANLREMNIYMSEILRSTKKPTTLP